MFDSYKIKEKVKERYGQIALNGNSCCDPLGSAESEGGCCSGNSNGFLLTSQSAVIK